MEEEHRVERWCVVSTPKIDGLFELIERSGTRGHFFGPMPEERVRSAEERLGVRFPSSHRQFVRRYGSGDVWGEEFFGLTPNDRGVPSAVWMTLEHRKEGLPDWMIVVQDAGAPWIYCLDTSQAEAGEAPVVMWGRDLPLAEQDLTPISPTFADFALERIREAQAPRGGTA